ncbi:hypothetical protein GQ53DRAFT_768402 [Thozetella sp. PMI_491]|nr:hypothetical protein GQ53DRAFT_768402 [Thozetella sp. PMI_491]
MHLKQTFLVCLALAALATAANIFPYSDVVDEGDMMAAMECLNDLFCSNEELPPLTNVRCKVNLTVAYVCNYAYHGAMGDHAHTGFNPCSLQEMVNARHEIASRTGGARTGWWLEPDWNKAYGFEKWCRRDEQTIRWLDNARCGDKCSNNRKKDPNR